VKGNEIRSKRVRAGLSGIVVCKKAGIARSRLSDIERGYGSATPDELARITAAIEDLARVKREIDRVAKAGGWPQC